MAIKFFVQKDIPKEIQADVCENIAVSPRIPLSCESISFKAFTGIGRTS